MLDIKTIREREAAGCATRGAFEWVKKVSPRLSLYENKQPWPAPQLQNTFL